MTLNKEAIRQRSEELQKGESDFSYLKLTESGSPHHIRILPAWNDSGIPWKEAYFHYGVNERTLACPKSNVNQPCPICDLVEEAAASKKKGDKKFADEMSSKFRAFLNVVDMKNQDAGVQVWPVGKMILKQVLSIMGDPDYEDITSPGRGHTLIIEVEGSGRNTRYTVRPRPKPSKIPDAVDVSGTPNLDNIVNVHSPEYIQAILDGDEPEDESFNAGDPNYVAPEEWEEGEEGKDTKRKPAPKAKEEKETKRKPKPQAKPKAEKEEPAEEEPAEEEAAEEEPAEVERLKCFAEYEEGHKTCSQCEDKKDCEAATSGEPAEEEAPAEEEEPAGEDKTEKEISSILDRLKKKKKK